MTPVIFRWDQVDVLVHGLKVQVVVPLVVLVQALIPQLMKSNNKRAIDLIYWLVLQIHQCQLTTEEMGKFFFFKHFNHL